MAKAANKKVEEVSLETVLWNCRVALRGVGSTDKNRDAVIGLCFLKFAGDKFEKRRAELIEQYGDIPAFLEKVSFYNAVNVFYLKETARWSYIVKNAGANDIAVILDQAMADIEAANPSLKGALSLNLYATLGAPKEKIKQLIDEVNKIDESRFQEEDLIGRVYEYFLQVYAASGTKEDGEFYTPACIVQLIAELIEPYDEAGQHAEDNGSKNMIIHGDNLEALKALLPRYEGKVKCIYIDPPYNTGNEKWVYNDNVNDPKIKKWLGEVVGREGEDLSRHDKWLCMMYPRLKLLQRLLSDDGVIFISIDDNELYNLKAICDEIFGARNFIANIVWQKTYSPRNDALGIPYETDNILVYSKNGTWRPNKLKRTAKMDARHDTPDNDPIPWQSGDVSAAGAADHQGMVYAIQQPITGKLIYPAAGRHWKDEQSVVLERMNKWAVYELRNIDDSDVRAQLCGVSKDDIRQDVMAVMLAHPIEESAIQAKKRYQEGNWPEYYFTSNGTGGIRFKNHIKQDNGKLATNLWLFNDVGHTDEAKKELKSIFNGMAPIKRRNQAGF